MKKIIPLLVVPLFAVAFILINCKPDSAKLSSSVTEAVPDKAEPIPPESPGYIPLAYLALQAAKANPKTSCEDISGLCDESMSTMQTMSVASVKADLCKCPDDPNRLCPCPGDTAMYLAAARKYKAKIEIDKKALKSQPVNMKGMEDWEAFVWPAKLPDGKYTLKISGVFFNNTKREYSTTFQVKDGKESMLWKR